MKDLELVPMTRPEFDGRRTALLHWYAGELNGAMGLSSADAEAEARRQMAALLPGGFDTERVLLRSAVAGGETVGWVWVSLPGAPGSPEMSWIYNIGVDPEHRRRGHGRAILLAVERELRGQGVTRIGLNVFGSNEPAINLYRSLGFQVTAQQMAKNLR